ncbi:MAG: hypothetical protein ACFFC9_10445 [Promethearchaeota archaeon]
MKKKELINYFKSFKLKVFNFFKEIDWFSYKRRWFIVKYGVIICILAFLFCYILAYHIIVESNAYGVLAKFSLNFSFVLIPALIYLIEVRRNFKKVSDKLFSLKDNLIYLRQYIAREISGLKNEEYKDEIIKPSSINQLIGSLRNLKFVVHAAMLLSYIENKNLFQIDLIIIDVIKKINKYDSGKYFKNIEQNWDFKNTKETIEKLEMTNKIDSLKMHFLDDLTFPIVYILMLNNPINDLAIYYHDQEEKKEKLIERLDFEKV